MRMYGLRGASEYDMSLALCTRVAALSRPTTSSIIKFILHALYVLSDWVAAGVQCGGLEFAKYVLQKQGPGEGPAAGHRRALQTSCPVRALQASGPSDQNTMIIQYNSSTTPAAATSIVCGVTTNNLTAWKSSKSTLHLTETCS